ncbi:hypothetical protein [Metabacillus lacus]|nr:hypothetical protein [Metabacillus lacus]
MMKQEQFLEILMNAYNKGERSNVTTKELLEDLILEIRKVYAT